MDVNEMDTESLERRLGEVTREIAEIKMQLDYARSAAAATGQYSDRDWFNRANHALRMKGIEHQKIQIVLGKRKKDERRAHNNSFDRRFIQAAKRRLDPDLFKDLMREADES